MGSLLAYSGIATKVRSMRSQLLKDKEYEQLAQFATVNEAAEFLKKRPSFREAFSGAGEGILHRATIEKLLFFTEYRDFIKIYRFSSMKLRNFLDIYFLNYERIFLVSLLRAITEKRESDIQIESLGEFFSRHASFSCEKAAQAHTTEELINALAGSPYYSCLHPLWQQGASLFDYEMAVDSYVFIRTWKLQKKKFGGEDYETLCRSYGCQIDLLNLTWLYRSKKYYRLNAAEIYQILLPVHYKLNKAVLRDMVEAATAEEFHTLLDKTYYGSRYKVQFERGEDGLYLERVYHALLYHIYNREFRKRPFSVAAVSAYLYAKRTETERLITTIEGIRYGLPPQSIIEHGKRYNLEVLNR